MLRAGLLLCTAAGLLAQSAPARFEAASIRLSNPDELNGPSGCETSPGLVRCTNVTLKRAIVGAYDVVPDRVLGGPEWIDSDRYQITARTNQPLAGEALDAMLQGLLAERFQLKLHRETRTRDAFVLEVARNGPQLRPAGDAARSYYNGHGHMEATSVTMNMFTQVLSRQLGLPVVDGTGLSGAFNFRLVWNLDSPLTSELGTGAASDTGVELFNAIQQQLGLVLRSRRMPVEMLVIDHVEKPGVN